MTSTRKGAVGGLERRPVFADSIIFKQKISSSFLRMAGWRGAQNWPDFVDAINVWPLIINNEWQIPTKGEI